MFRESGIAVSLKAYALQIPAVPQQEQVDPEQAYCVQSCSNRNQQINSHTFH